MSSDYSCVSCRMTVNRAVAKFCSRCGALLLLNQRYRLISKIGEGGFSTVYKAEDNNLGNALRAVKEMSVQSRDPQEVQQAKVSFQQEACLLATLRHSNLPQVYDHFEQSDRSYLVMEFIEGQTLEDYLAKIPRAKLPLQEVLEIGIQICTVLDYLHTHQPSIIFRDLKPANVMHTPKGHLYLIDFGIARLFKPGKKKDTVAMGSPGFAAPEQHGKGQTTVRADIYSLGATLHYLLSGRDPSEKPFQFPPLDLTQHAPAGPKMAKLIGRMVELDEQKRPPSAQVIRQDLQRIAQQLIEGKTSQSRANKDSAAKAEQWRICEAKWKKQEVLTGRVIYHNKRGLVVDVDGLRGFVPLSQISNRGKKSMTEQDLQDLAASTLQLKITEIDPAQKRLMLSERRAVKDAAGGSHTTSPTQASSVKKPSQSPVVPESNSAGSSSQYASPVAGSSQGDQWDERSSIGDEAEEYAGQIIQARLKARNEGACLRGPLLLMPGGGFQESDFLVYTGGVLFCLEVKNWSGTVTYAPRYRTVQSFGEASMPHKKFDGYDYSHVLFQARPGRNGEAAVERIHENPLEKTSHFITDLKTYLGRKNPYFQQVSIIPVVAFTHRAGISSIHDFQKGIISLKELDDYFDDRIQRTNPRPASPSLPWIRNVIAKVDDYFDNRIQHTNPPSSSPSLRWVKDIIENEVPNWDRILMRGKTTWTRGVLVGRLTFTGIDNKNYLLPPYSDLDSIGWQKTTGSLYYGKQIYEMMVRYMNGSSRIYNCISGRVHLAPTPGAKPRIYEVQDLQELTVGLANKEMYP